MNKDLMKKYEEIQEGIGQLQAQLSDITGMATEEVREYGEQAMGEVSDNVKRAVKLTKENPWTTLVVVSAALLLVGLVAHSSRSEK